ncbi:hypothetical protein J3D55_004625 [Chryseobacterium ginsenosidimutans]|uniref:hypothetical protein n=1 Tax=Chryseobacterium ginsenosidimutans TaxID=687846 RepID=UPI00216A9796|nr:hypothetical protein [Chryseobacterium ginsenosidimutans]MCS3871709.1 hypothetical protein [Chryseobacterium ginsenosidimutans]
MKFKNIYHKKSVYIILLMVFSCCFKAQTISATGSNWAVTVPSITEAGSNYTGLYESATNQVVLSVSVPLLLGNAKVSVHYEVNPTWHNSLILSAKRTSNGTTLCALCSITGGTAYQTITLTDLELFRIQAVLALASYTGINIQLQLSGVSVTIPATAYQSRIVFTVSPI